MNRARASSSPNVISKIDPRFQLLSSFLQRLQIKEEFLGAVLLWYVLFGRPKWGLTGRGKGCLGLGPFQRFSNLISFVCDRFSSVPCWRERNVPIKTPPHISLRHVRDILPRTEECKMSFSDTKRNEGRLKSDFWGEIFFWGGWNASRKKFQRQETTSLLFSFHFHSTSSSLYVHEKNLTVCSGPWQNFPFASCTNSLVLLGFSLSLLSASMKMFLHDIFFLLIQSM